MQEHTLHRISLPGYSRSEEIFNMVSHIVGSVFALIMLVMSVIKSFFQNDSCAILCSIVYSTCIFIMFTISSVYHGLLPCKGKRVMRVIDHCDIYLAIAGTYTPILLVGIRQFDPTIAWILFGIQWGVAAIAIIFTSIDFNKFSKISFAGYIIMGWCIIVAIFPTIQAMTIYGFIWLLLGGISFSIGAILYVLGKKHTYAHSIFHVFVVIGVILQFVGIYNFVL